MEKRMAVKTKYRCPIIVMRNTSPFVSKNKKILTNRKGGNIIVFIRRIK
jgi:hypothetical protein